MESKLETIVGFFLILCIPFMIAFAVNVDKEEAKRKEELKEQKRIEQEEKVKKAEEEKIRAEQEKIRKEQEDREKLRRNLEILKEENPELFNGQSIDYFIDNVEELNIYNDDNEINIDNVENIENFNVTGDLNTE